MQIYGHIYMPMYQILFNLIWTDCHVINNMETIVGGQVTIVHTSVWQGMRASIEQNVEITQQPCTRYSASTQHEQALCTCQEDSHNVLGTVKAHKQHSLCIT